MTTACRLAALALLLLEPVSWADEPLFLARAAWQKTVEAAVDRATSRGELIVAYFGEREGPAAAESLRLERGLLTTEAFLDWGRKHTLLYLTRNAASLAKHRALKATRWPVVVILDAKGEPLATPKANTLTAWRQAAEAARRRLALRAGVEGGETEARVEDFALGARFGQIPTLAHARMIAASIRLQLDDARLAGCLASLAIREVVEDVRSTARRSGRAAARRLASRRFLALWRRGVRPDASLSAESWLFWQSLRKSTDAGARQAAATAIDGFPRHPRILREAAKQDQDQDTRK